MSHYQHQYYASSKAGPVPTSGSGAPIQSSFYAARQRFEQQTQAQVNAYAHGTPPHLRSNAFDYRQYPAPPRHPVQQTRGGGHGQHGQQGHSGQPGGSHAQHHAQPQAQAQAQVQTQQYARPQSQYGQVQTYQPPYAQPQPQVQAHPQAQAQPSQRASMYASRPQAAAPVSQSQFNPAGYAQRMPGGYSSMDIPMPPQTRGRPTPAQAFALYEAYNARQQQREAVQQAHAQMQAQSQAQAQVQQPPQQPQQPQLQQQVQLHRQHPPPVTPSLPPQNQCVRPPAIQQTAPPIPVPPFPQPRPREDQTPTVGTRRPLPQPGQARPRPLSMPPQSQPRSSTFQPSRLGHKPSFSISSVLPQSPTEAAPAMATSFHSPSSSSPASILPTTTSISAPISPSVNAPRITNIHLAESQVSERAPVLGEVATQRTPTQRRALPKSPIAPPDLTRLHQRRSLSALRTNADSMSFQTVKPALSPPSSVSSQNPSQSSQPQPSQIINSDVEDDEDRLSVVSRESKGSIGTRQRTPSPQYGILDLPERDPQVLNAKSSPSSPQYGIKDLPSRTKSVVDRRKAWERAEQGMSDAVVRPQSKPASPTKSTFSMPVPATLAKPKSAPITPARSPQPQTPQQQQKLPMPVVRQPQPSRTERTPSWTLPTADLGKIASGVGAPTGSDAKGEQKTSMALRFAKMTPEEANKAQPRPGPVVPQSQMARPVTKRDTGSISPSSLPTKTYPFSARAPRRSVNVDLNLDDPPPTSLRRTPSPSTSTASSSVPSIPTIKTPEDVPQIMAPAIPKINLPGDFDVDDVSPPVSVPEVKVRAPAVIVSPTPSSPQKANIPVINLPGDEDDTDSPSSGPMISVSSPSPKAKTNGVSMPVILDDLANSASQTKARGLPRPPSVSASSIPTNSSSSTNVRSRGGGLVCGGCNKGIIGRIVSAMGLRWHPQCFKCCRCGEQLEHVSSYEHDGKPYCHLDYHELFAPQCYSCKTPIIDERFITLDDPALGKRTYHEQHFFCAECGDPFLAPSPAESSSKRSGPNEINIKGDGAFDVALDEDGMEVGFTVFRGHPYCEACHVRLRAPKCKACKKSIRDGMRAVEALGGKWCYECFVCAGCQKPFDEPSFFQRDKNPFCEHCFSIILRNEL